MTMVRAVHQLLRIRYRCNKNFSFVSRVCVNTTNHCVSMESLESLYVMALGTRKTKLITTRIKSVWHNCNQPSKRYLSHHNPATTLHISLGWDKDTLRVCVCLQFVPVDDLTRPAHHNTVYATLPFAQTTQNPQHCAPLTTCLHNRTWCSCRNN